MLEEEDRSAFATLALCQVRDLRTDGSLVLDDAAYPTSLSLQAAPPLARYVREIATLMYERAKSIAARLASPSQSGVAEVTDFNLLQTLNRLHPVFSHLAQLPHVHPESLYCLMAQACGELATFTEASRLPEATPAYRHDLPHLAFKPLEEALRRSLGTVLQPRAIAIALHKESYGVISAPLADTQLIENAQFILAVRASLPVERLRQQFVQQAKVAARETLTELIQLQLPGIPLVPLPVAPRHLPFHAGFSYFELDQGDSAWAMMRGASGFGLHVAGELPDLELQFWAIRSE
jgi:type VI secretion system protein ImpJ